MHGVRGRLSHADDKDCHVKSDTELFRSEDVRGQWERGSK